MNPSLLCLTAGLFFKCLSIVSHYDMTFTIFPGTEVRITVLLINGNNIGYLRVSRDLPRLQRYLVDDQEGSCHNICYFHQYSCDEFHQGPWTRQHSADAAGPLQFQESPCCHIFMVLQLKGPGSPRPTRIIKDLWNKNQITMNASTFSLSLLEGWSPSQVSLPVFSLDLFLLLKYFLKSFVLFAPTLPSFNSDWYLAFPVISLHNNILFTKAKCEWLFLRVLELVWDFVSHLISFLRQEGRMDQSSLRKKCFSFSLAISPYYHHCTAKFFQMGNLRVMLFNKQGSTDLNTV